MINYRWTLRTWGAETLEWLYHIYMSLEKQIFSMVGIQDDKQH